MYLFAHLCFVHYGVCGILCTRANKEVTERSEVDKPCNVNTHNVVKASHKKNILKSLKIIEIINLYIYNISQNYLLGFNYS